MSISPEQIPQISNELALRNEPGLHVVGRQLGKHALMFDGFEPMEEVESPYEEMQAELESRIIDQPEAIAAVVKALERSEVRMPDDKHPIANLAFLGPSGVGKSELAKTITQLRGYNGGNLIKIDCSDYSHGHEVATLTGAPVGYIGSDLKPLLSKKTVEQKGTVILFDEIEKGSTELYNLMLQIMEDGELRLKNGATASFRDTIIILTSNLGAKEMSAMLSDTPFGLGEQNKKTVNKKDMEKVAIKKFEKFFAPEFINRLNDMIVFHPLTTQGLGKVLDVKLNKVNQEYERQLGAMVSLSDATKDHLVDIALQQPHKGARPMVRALEDNVQTVFGRYAGGGHIKEGTHIRVFHTSEAPASYRHTGEGELIFTSKFDETVKKPESNSVGPMFKEAVAIPANPEHQQYDVTFEEHDLDEQIPPEEE